MGHRGASNSKISPLRRVLNEALKHIIHLEHGLAGAVAPVSDPGQLRELQKAKTRILAAIDLEVEEKVRHRRRHARTRCRRQDFCSWSS